MYYSCNTILEQMFYFFFALFTRTPGFQIFNIFQ
nr:MAG TPA: hypothetical protein [Caudoviricetes sp.]